MGPWAPTLLGLSLWDGDGWLVSTPLCLGGAMAEPLCLKPCLSSLLEEATGQAQKDAELPGNSILRKGGPEAGRPGVAPGSRVAQGGT